MFELIQVRRSGRKPLFLRVSESNLERRVRRARENWPLGVGLWHARNNPSGAGVPWRRQPAVVPPRSRSSVIFLPRRLECGCDCWCLACCFWRRQSVAVASSGEAVIADRNATIVRRCSRPWRCQRLSKAGAARLPVRELEANPRPRPIRRIGAAPSVGLSGTSRRTVRAWLCSLPRKNGKNSATIPGKSPRDFLADTKAPRIIASEGSPQLHHGTGWLDATA